jgi:hypothetical protein
VVRHEPDYGAERHPNAFSASALFPARESD